jgi:hypothetical protein
MAASKFGWQLDAPVLQAFAIIIMMAWEAPWDQHVHRIIPMAVTLLLVPSFLSPLDLSAVPIVAPGPPLIRSLWIEASTLPIWSHTQRYSSSRARDSAIRCCRLKLLGLFAERLAETPIGDDTRDRTFA